MKTLFRTIAVCAALIFALSCSKENPENVDPDSGDNTELPSDALAYASVQQANAVIESYIEGITDSNSVFWSVTSWWPTKSWIYVHIGQTTLSISFCSYFEILPKQGSGSVANEDVVLNYGLQEFPETSRQQIIDYYKADSRVEKVESYDKRFVDLQLRDRNK